MSLGRIEKEKAVQYLLSVMADGSEPVPSEAEMNEMFARVGEFNAQVQADGQWVFANGLEPPTAATSIDPRGEGDPVVTKAAWIPAKEHLSGLWIIDVPDEQTAIEVATRGAQACGRVVEVRPFHG